MIDTHIHVVPPNLPGVGSLSPLLEQPVEIVAAALRREMQAAGVIAALAMGSARAPEPDLLGVDATLAVARSVPGLHAIGVADPARVESAHLARVETVLAAGHVKALKGYLGYLHFGPDHPGYVPYFELAAHYGLPFIFHTGDTYSPRAKLRFAHPLLVDDVAVDHPRVRFVLAHLGNPWLTEAAEVVYKNVNVWADLSGFVIGGTDAFTDEERRELLHETVTAVGRAFRYAERPNRFLYGSDWPLAPMADYREFVRAAIPEVHHQQVFEDNARALFRI
jgi:predicted TIM-barrel fold metal-dependent hydrolase